ncbi:MAG: RNA-binding protein [Limisphaerales bacterium]
MISNERPPGYSPSFNDRSHNSDRPSYQSAPLRPRVDEDTIKTETIQIERKTFILTLKENPRGRFLRITEDVNGRRDNVIIPSTGLEEFSKILTAMAQAASQSPAQPA